MVLHHPELADVAQITTFGAFWSFLVVCSQHVQLLGAFVWFPKLAVNMFNVF